MAYRRQAGVKERALPASVPMVARGSAVFASACMMLISIAATAGEIVELPKWQLEDIWTYSRVFHPTPGNNFKGQKSQYTMRVAVKADDYFTCEVLGVDADGKNARWMTRWSTATNFMNRIGSPPRWQEYRWYQWPLIEGQTWDFAWNQPGSNEDLKWTVTVGGWENITVPAGTFRALRIQVDNSCYFQGVDGGACGQQDRVWYAPEVKTYVRLERRTNKGAYLGTNMVDELLEYQIK